MQQVLNQVGYLSDAQKLSLEALVQIHLACQLGQYRSWPHAVTMVGCTPGAQAAVLPTCPPPDPNERERQSRRKRIAELKKLPVEQRWSEVAALFQRWQQQPQPPVLPPSPPISESQLSRSNRRVLPTFWSELVEVVVAEVTAAIGPAEMPGVGPVRAVDATVFSLPSSCQWATFRKEWNAVKVLAEYDVITALVQTPIITKGVVHEAKTFRKRPKEPGVTYLFDRGFLDYAEFDEHCRRGVYFVTRCKENTVIAPLTSYPVPSGSNVVADQEVVLGGENSHMQHSVRLITVQLDDGSCLRLITNRFDLPAATIALLYRHRWQIELFFRWLKHHFKTLRCFGRSEPAIHAQIYAACLAHTLLVFRYHQLGYRGSLLQFSRHVTAGLFAPVDPSWEKAAA